MYTLVRSMSPRQLLVEQLPVFLVSLIVAELFYKFHSFTLETLAFLATWYVADAITRLATRFVADKLKQPN